MRSQYQTRCIECLDSKSKRYGCVEEAIGKLNDARGDDDCAELCLQGCLLRVASHSALRIFWAWDASLEVGQTMSSVPLSPRRQLIVSCTGPTGPDTTRRSFQKPPVKNVKAAFGVGRPRAGNRDTGSGIV